MHTNLVWVLDVQSCLCNILPRSSLHIKRCLITNNTSPNTIRTFGLRIKQFLTTANILETPSYFVLPPWCIKRPTIVLDLKKYRMDIWDRYRDYIPVYADGLQDGNSVVCTTVLPSDTVISTRLSDSVSIFTAEIWAIMQARPWNKLNIP